jgi:hypothetical protein
MNDNNTYAVLDDNNEVLALHPTEHLAEVAQRNMPEAVGVMLWSDVIRAFYGGDKMAAEDDLKVLYGIERM